MSKKIKNKIKKEKSMDLEEAFMTFFTELILRSTSGITYEKTLGAAGLRYKCNFYIAEITDPDGKLVAPEDILKRTEEILSAKAEEVEAKKKH